MRRLLALFRQPRKLESDPLAILLRDALRTKSAHDALKSIIDKALAGATQADELMRNIIASRDAGGYKSRKAAASLGLSLRSYFRYRAAAIDAVAAQIDRDLRANPEQTRYEVQLADMVSRFDPQVAFELYHKAIDKPRGRAAYNLLCLAIKAGRPITRELVEGCEGPWRALAMAALGRKYLIAGRPRTAMRWRAKVSRAITKLNTPADHTAAFELAHFDRLEAVRRCDMNAAREAAQRMAWHARSNSDLLGIALVAEAEQACDDGDLARAAVVLAALANLNASTHDFRVMGRTAHAQALLALMQGHWDEAFDIARLAAIALSEIDPGYAFCAHANVGRAALLVAKAWAPPESLLHRYPGSWITGMLSAVRSRYTLESDPEISRKAAKDALEISVVQGAAGVLRWAQCSLAFALDKLGAASEADKMRIDAWESAVRLSRRSYLYDMFVHPLMDKRAIGAFDLSPRFVQAIRRWAQEMIVGQFGALPNDTIAAVDRLIRSALAASLAPTQSQTQAGGNNGKSASAWRKSRRAAPTIDELADFLAPRLTSDIAICLPFDDRDGFARRFSDALRAGGNDQAESDLIAAS